MSSKERNWKTSNRRKLQPRYNVASTQNSLGIISESTPISNQEREHIVEDVFLPRDLHSQSSNNSDGHSRDSSGSGNIKSDSNDIFQIIEQDGLKSQQQKLSNTPKRRNSKTFNGKSSSTSPTKIPPQHAFSKHDNAYHNKHIISNTHKGQIQETGDQGCKDEDDDDGPIIYANHQDCEDDAISQITSSISGTSIYSHDYMFATYTPTTKSPYHSFLENSDDNNNEESFKDSSRNDVELTGRDEDEHAEEKKDSMSAQLKDGEGSSLSDIGGSGDVGGSEGGLSTVSSSPSQPNQQHQQKPSVRDNEGELNGGSRIGSIASASTTNTSNITITNTRLNFTDDEILSSAMKDDGSNDVFDNVDEGDVVNIYANNFLASRKGQSTDDDDDLMTMKEMYSTTSKTIHNTRKNSQGYNYASAFHDDPTVDEWWNEDSLSGTLRGIGESMRSFLFRMRRAMFFHTTGQQHSRHKKDDDESYASSYGDDDEMNDGTTIDYFEMILSPLNSDSGGNTTTSTGLENSSRSENTVRSRRRNQSMMKKRYKASILVQIGGLCIFLKILLHLIKVGNDEALRKQREFIVQNMKKPVQQGRHNLQGEVIEERSDLTDSLPGLLRGAGGRSEDDFGEPHNMNIEMQEQLQENAFGSPSRDDQLFPPILNNFADIADAFNPAVEIPFFWHVPRSAGATMNDVMGECYHLRLASNAGGMGGHNLDDSLQVLAFDNSHVSYVNVDVSDGAGIDRAVRLGLASSRLADVVMSSLLHESARIFDPTRRGRMFTLLRHPVERAVSLFYFWQEVQWKNPRTYNKELAEISIEDYFRNSWMGESNWQVRFLTNQITKGEIDENDLNLAKEVLRRKCLVGLLSEKTASLERFEKYFGWKVDGQNGSQCVEKLTQFDWPLRREHREVEQGSELWDMIAAHNTFDIQLYQYAQTLFQEQSVYDQ